MNQILKLNLFLALLLGAALMWVASPAQANNQTISQGLDKAWVTQGYTCTPSATCVQEHRVIHVRDHECDGHTVTVYYYVQGRDTKYALTDTDGCNGYYYSENWTTFGLAITKMQLCEHWSGGKICTAWYHVYSHAAA